MSFQPPKPATNRSGLRFGVLVFACAALGAAALMLSPLWRRVPVADPAAPPALAHPVSPPNSVRFAPARTVFALPPLARLAATNLAPRGGVTRAAAATNMAAIRGVAGCQSPATNGVAGGRRELPIFTLLRASPRQPVPSAVAELARQITRDCHTDADRAKALYDWITEHITYDWQEWSHIVSGADSYMKPEDPASVIERRTAVCAGYAWLFDAMAGSVGLDASFVIGDVRGYRGTPDDDLVAKYQHAWNSVTIDGASCLLDATWGARQNGETTADFLNRRAYYFETPANQMIFDHLPESEDQQLLANPISAQDFQMLPNLKPPFFQDDLRLATPFASTITTPPFTSAGVTLAAPAGVLVAATLTQGTQDISGGNLAIQENGARRDVLIGPLPPGSYILRLYAKPAENNGLFQCCADYAVQVTR